MMIRTTENHILTKKTVSLVWFISLILIGCNKKDADPVKEIAGLEILSNHPQMIADGRSTVRIWSELSYADGSFATEVPVISVNGTSVDLIDGAFDFNTTEEGTYKFTAELRGVVSEPIYIKARPPMVLSEIEIPVIFHMAQDHLVSTASATLAETLEALNELINQTEYDTESPNRVPLKISFVMAETDPDGNALAERGVNRYVYSIQDFTRTVQYEDWMWDYFWDPDYYVNIWIGNVNNGAQWAGFGALPILRNGAPRISLLPEDASATPSYLHGVVLKESLFDFEPTHPNTVALFAHEFGHYFGLHHLYFDDCSNDAVNDTPQYASPNSPITCDETRIFSKNFLSGEIDKNTFTYGQNERIRHVIKYAKWRAQEGMTVREPGGAANLGPKIFSPKKMVKPANAKAPNYVN